WQLLLLIDSALTDALKLKNFELCQKLVEKIPSIDKYPFSICAQLALSPGNGEAVQFLIEQGFNPSFTDGQCQAAITSAILNKDQELQNVLFQAGVTPYTPLFNGSLPLYKIVELAPSSVVRDLLQSKFAPSGNEKPPEIATRLFGVAVYRGT